MRREAEEKDELDQWNWLFLVTKIKLNFISQFSTKIQSHQTYVTLHLVSLSLASFGNSWKWIDI